MAGEAAVSGGAVSGGTTAPNGTAPTTGPGSGDGKAPVGGQNAKPSGVPGVMKREPVVEKKAAPGTAPSKVEQNNLPDAKPPAGAKPPEAPKGDSAPEAGFPRTIKHVINGKTHETVVNSWDELDDVTQRWNAEALRGRQFQSEATRQKQLLERAKNDPRARAELLKQIGYDPRTDVVEQLRREYEMEQMDPKDRELAEAREKLAEYERKQKEAEEAAQRAEEERAMQAAEAEVEREIIGAMEELGDIVDTETRPEVALYIIDVLRDAARRGETLSPKQAAARVRRMEEGRAQRVSSRLNERVKGLQGTALIEHLNGIDPSLVERIVAAHLDSTAPRDVPLTTSQPPPEAPTPTVRGDDEERKATMGINFRSAPRMGF